MGSGVPNEIGLTLENFERYKKRWINNWRAIGHHDANGNFVVPVSFTEARTMPRSEIDTYLELDALFSILQNEAKKNDKRG